MKLTLLGVALGVVPLLSASRIEPRNDALFVPMTAADWKACPGLPKEKPAKREPALLIAAAFARYPRKMK
jgi:hypothetical protein